MPTTIHTAPGRRLVFGTRGSLLARTQTDHVRALLAARMPDWELPTELIRTEGDELQTVTRPEVVWPHLGIGVFTRQLEDALAQGVIDVAVHSLKDLPTRCPDGLVLAAIPRRAVCWDLLVFADDPGPVEGWARREWIVGTSSIRREAFLKRHYPHWRTLPIRGNVDTRLSKLKGGVCAALCLAAAGLERLGWWSPSQPSQLDTPNGRFFVRPFGNEDGLLPAPGQGALAIQMRAEDARVPILHELLNDPVTAAAIAAERACLEALGGGCRVPIGAWGRPASSPHRLALDGMVLSPDGQQCIDAGTTGALTDPGLLGQAVGQRLIEQGARILLGEAGA